MTKSIYSLRNRWRTSSRTVTLRFDKLIPDELNKAAHAEMESGVIVRGRGGTVLNDVWGDESAVGKVFGMPEVQGIIQSLVGEDPLYDHHAVHIVRPSKRGWSNLARRCDHRSADAF